MCKKAYVITNKPVFYCLITTSCLCVMGAAVGLFFGFSELLHSIPIKNDDYNSQYNATEPEQNHVGQTADPDISV
ncbi:MAG: hypothetical protein RLN62_04200 [Rickettsiales bacterium]